MVTFTFWEIVFDNQALSDWAYNYCRYEKNNFKVRKYITSSIDAYLYCKNVRDDPKIRRFITEPPDAFLYCTWVRSDIQWLRKLGKLRDKNNV